MFDTRRPWITPVGALAATAVVGAGLLVAAHFAQRSDAAPRLAPIASPAPSAGVLTTADLGVTAPAKPAKPGRIGVAAAPVTVRYTFDGGVTAPITDASGGFELRPLGQNGGTLSLVPQGSGLAVQYPSRCTLPRERDCPRAILEGARDDSLNPGTRPMQYGASVLMTATDLADGANVFQKGYSVGGVSQFKLQVDHHQGHPSCVIASRTRIYRAEPRINVADGVWHDLACTRTPTHLTLSVDGVDQASVPVPKNLSIANAEPLRVGGKGANNGNDQYAGQIDNVFLAIG